MSNQRTPNLTSNTPLVLSGDAAGSMPGPPVKPPFRGPSIGDSSPLNFDGGSVGAKDIQRIDIWHDQTTIRDISIAYVDGTVSGPHAYGKVKPRDNAFELTKGEFITDVFAWSDCREIEALQFVKNTAQMSPLYGATTGLSRPYVMSGDGHALLAFSGYAGSQSLSQLQPVWRSDIWEDKYRRIAVSTMSQAPDGNFFNDYEFLSDPYTARISKLHFRNTTNQPVLSFRVTYTSGRDAKTVTKETHLRGTDSGPLDTWTLDEDEYINRVKGKVHDWGIMALDITTNKGKNKKFGRDMDGWGIPFNFAPPNNDMGLYYIIGKSGDLMNHMTFVWGTRPA